MKLSQFKFKLPDELIAQYPSPNRDECRLMVVDSRTGEISHHIFKDVLDFFDEGDVMVFNDTKVFPHAFTEIRRRPAQLSRCSFYAN